MTTYPVALALIWAIRLQSRHALVSASNADQTVNEYHSFFCFENSSPDLVSGGDYICVGANDDILRLDSQLSGVFYCNTPDLNAPNRQNCSSFCGLYSFDTQTFCHSCGFTDNQTLAYDCHNLFPNAECNQKDVDGSCDEEYIHWTCEPRGLGFFCQARVFENNLPRNVAFLKEDDEVQNSKLELLCANDIGGGKSTDCQEPICHIVDLTNFATCSSCQLLPDGTFAYDCAKQIPFLECGIRDTSGNCLSHNESISDTPKVSAVTTAKNTFEKSTTESSDENWSYTFSNMDPTVFNVLSDIFAYVTRILVGLAIAALCPLIMTFQLKRGGIIPFNELGVTPGDFVHAMQQANTLQWTVPALLLVLLLALADFSHTLADVGLDFVTISQTGPMQPVMNFDERNPHRLMQTMGDPLFSRTVVFPKVLSESCEVTTGCDDGNYDASRPLSSVVSSFLSAIALVAQGDSPFITSVDQQLQDVTMADVPGFVGLYTNDASPLATMEKQIPLLCGGKKASSSMVSIEQVITGIPLYEEPLESTDLVPNCTFSTVRSTGIFGETYGLAAEILETALYTGISTSDLFSSVNGSATEHPIFLRNGSSLFQTLELTPQDKKLARDRANWKQGRQISGVDGIVIGTNNLTVSLGTVVLATGPQTTSLASSEAQRQYALMGEILGECPPRPSGYPVAKDTQCMAQIILNCNTFPEDFAPVMHPLYYPPSTETTTCSLQSVDFVWGQHFVINAELVTVVAGIYGLTQPTISYGVLRAFSQHSLLAALFALGTLQDRPSIENVVRPNVNLVYVLFMLLPAVLSIVLVVVAYSTRRYCLSIPSDPWQVMVLAQQSPAIPSLNNKEDPCPDPDPDLALAFFDAPQQQVSPDEEEPVEQAFLGIVHAPNKFGRRIPQRPSQEEQVNDLKLSTTRSDSDTF